MKKKINWEIILLIFFIITLLISFRIEHKSYMRYKEHKQEKLRESVDRVKDVGIYFNIIIDNVSKFDTTKIDSVQKIKIKNEKVN